MPPPSRAIFVVDRCNLCHLKFEHGDDISLGEEGWADQLARLVWDAGGIMETGPNVGCLQRVQVVPIPWPPTMERALVQGQHTSCASAFFPLCQRGKPLKIEFEPSEADERRRASWASKESIAVIGAALPARIPNEIVHDIAGYVFRQFLVHFPVCGVPAKKRFKLDRPLFVTHAEHEGIRYITSISNRFHKGISEPVYIPDPEKPVQVVYTVENYQGIVAVHLGHTLRDLPEARHKKGFWWRSIRVPDEPHYWQVSTDTRKVRYVSPVTTAPARQERDASLTPEDRNVPTASRWPYPVWCDSQPPVRYMTNRRERAPLMKPSVWLDKTDTGISFCFKKGILFAMHAHVADEKHDFYRELTPEGGDSLWVHVPLSRGDQIVEMWKRTVKASPAQHPGQEISGLVLLLASHVPVLVGVCPPEDDHDPKFKLLFGMVQPGGVRHIAAHRTRNGIQALAFLPPGDVQPARAQESLEYPKPTYDKYLLRDHHLPTFPGALNTGPYLESTAILDNVVQYTVCQDPTTKVVRGLVLANAHGDLTCLGEVRLDHLLPPVSIPPPEGELWFWFDKRDNLSKIVAVNDGEEPGPGLVPFLVFLEGRLFWSFTHRFCVLTYEGNTSPITSWMRPQK